MKPYEILKQYIINKNKIKLQAHGNSMSPVINDGDILLIDSGISILNPGDIILYYSSTDTDIYIAHRIIRSIKNMMYITKGDNNTYIENICLLIRR